MSTDDTTLQQQPAAGASSTWHTQSVESVIDSLHTDIKKGLTESDVKNRQSQYGLNELATNNGASWIKILLRQAIDIMNWIFVALGIVCYVMSDYITGTLLIALGIANLIMCFAQEYAAEQTLAALRNLSSPTATVLRDGHETTIASKDLVPGDVLLVQEGDTVAADARLIYISNLEVDEALLTGESLPVQKQLVVIDNIGKFDHVWVGGWVCSCEVCVVLIYRQR